MTDMKRITVAIPDGLDEKIIALRKTDKFVRCSYSEIMRQAVERGLELMETNQPNTLPQSASSI